MNEAKDAARLYLDLIEKSLQNAIFGESRIEMAVQAVGQKLRHPYATRRGTIPWPIKSHTMIGQARLRSLRELVETTIRENIPGDYIETGIWRGGACILMRAVLAAYGVRDRKVFCADSFEGLPPPSPEKYPADKRDRLYRFRELAISEDIVRANFAAYDLLDDQVVFLKGFFSETLPRLTTEKFAIIRLDGDMYESTMDALTSLYDRVPDGGFVIIDDYGALRNCARAVHDFLDRRNVTVELKKVDESCVWWRKS
jgi:O-methyltransferase